MSLLSLVHVADGGVRRFLAGLASLALLAALTAPAQAGNHGDAGPPDDTGPPEDTGPSGELDESAEGITRVSGPNRFLTAVALSRHSHPEDDADEVFVATGGGFADALAGAPAAAAVDAPVLFSPPGNMHRPVADRLVELDPETVTVLGGPAAVSPRIVGQIEDLVPDVAVERLGGGDRFGTAVTVSEATHPDPDEVGEVLLVTGGRFPDALAGGPVAASLGAPVLLATADALPESTTAELARLDPETVTALGGPGAISDEVLEQAAGSVGAESRRVAGDDRFETAIAASQLLSGDGETATAYVATGVGWADALAGSAAAGADAAPVLLTTPGQLPDSVAEELARLAPDEVVVLGGPGAITRRVAEQVAEAVDDGG